MTIGQALALMRSAEQFKDYQNRLNAQPTIDWRDVTQQPVGPEAPVYPEFQARDIVVRPEAMPEDYTQYESPVGPLDQYAVENPIAGEPYQEQVSAPVSRGPIPFDYSAVLPQQTVAAEEVEMPSYYAASAGQPYDPTQDRNFLELYGAPAPSQPTTLGAQSPAMFADSYGGTPQQPVERLPLLPLPYTSEARRAEIAYGASPELAMLGDRERRKKKKKTDEEVPVESAPETQVEVAPEIEPTLAITPELGTVTPMYDTDVALREQMGQAMMATPAAPVTPIKTQQPTQPAWKPGQPFSVDLQIGGKTYQGQVTDVPSNPSQPVNVTIGKTTYPIYADQDPEMYAKIQERRDQLMQSVAPKDDFTSEINIDGEWFPAKIDDRTGRIIYKYKDPEAGFELPVVYNKKSVLDLTADEFRGPITSSGGYDDTQIRALQNRLRNPLTSSIQALNEIKTGYKGQADIPTIRQNLIGKIVDGGDGKPLGDMEWSYRTDRGVIPLSQAVELGYVSPTIQAELERGYKNFINRAEVRATVAKAMQSGEAPTMKERNVKEAEAAVKTYEDLIKKTTDPAELKTYQKALQEAQKKLAQVQSKVGPVTDIGGGVKLIEEGEDVYTYGLDPLTREGILALLAGAPAAPSPDIKGDAYMPFTESDIAMNIANQVLGDIKVTPTADDQQWEFGIEALANKYAKIQRDLTDAARAQGIRPQDLIDQEAWYATPRSPLGARQASTEAMTSEGANTIDYFWTKAKMSEVLDDLVKAANQFKEAIRGGDSAKIEDARKNLGEKAKMASSQIIVRTSLDPNVKTGLTYQPTPTEKLLSDVASRFKAPSVLDYQMTRPELTTPGTQRKPAPKLSTVRENQGTEEDVPNAQPWYPVTKMTTLAPGGKNGLVNSEFKLWEFMSRPEVAVGIASKLDSLVSTTFSTQEVSHALGNDAGQPLSSQDLAVLDQTVNKFNQFMASDDGRAARKQYFTALLTMIGNLGYPVTSSSGIETKFGIAEQAREAAKKGNTNEVLKLRKQYYENIVGKKGHTGNIKFVLDRTAGFQSAQLAKSYPGDYGSNIRFPSGEASNSRLYDNMVQSQMEIFDLIVASGTNAVSIPVGSGRTVTWFVNPANPNVVNTHIPAIAMPSSIKGDRSGPTPIKSAEKKAGDADVMDGVTKDMDPALTSVLLSVGSIFGGGLMTPIIEGWSKVNDSLIDIAQRNYREGGVAAEGGGRDYSGTGEARKENKRVTFNNESRKSVSSHSLNALMIGNIFPKNRDRKSDQIPGMLFKGITTK